MVRLRDELTAPLLKTTGAFIDGLKAMKIETVQDLLLHFPRDHEDLSQMMTIIEAPLGQKVTLRGVISKLKMVRTRTRKILVQATFIDEEGNTAQVVWFNQAHIMRMLRDGQDVTLTGKVVENGYKLQIQSPTFESSARGQLLHAGRIVPVYPQSEGITSRWLREKIALVKPAINEFNETLPPEIIASEKLMSRADAIHELHYPTTPEKLQEAKDRFAFEEMFEVQRQALERKREWQGERQKRLQIEMDPAVIKAFFGSLQFEATFDQKRSILEILKDMEQDRPMSRLLEGDVGSGKTLVAVAVIVHALRRGGQCAVMVPTEVLAKQHAASITRLLLNCHAFIQKSDEPAYQHLKAMRLPTVSLLTGSTPQSEASAIRRSLGAGLTDVVIGTHSLIEDSVTFKNLVLAIVDEQHRFGVAQRQRLRDKGSPHFLSMTATPIPRTLALTAFGEHDLSVLLEKPGNRKKIQTKVVPPSGRKTVELFIDQQIREGRQVFVICPLITESTEDAMAEVKSVDAEEKRLKEAFAHRRIAKLHGKMTPQEKDSVMLQFKDKQFDILVSTSVIEVGIDVPNATLIIIEGSERFGLSQLHQFRGRVGRSDHHSYCYLFTTTPEQARSERLKAMEATDSGFELAEIDMKLRGPGELYGFRQSGLAEMQFGSLLDPKMVVRARKAAERVLI